MATPDADTAPSCHHPGTHHEPRQLCYATHKHPKVKEWLPKSVADLQDAIRRYIKAHDRFSPSSAACLHLLDESMNWKPWPNTAAAGDLPYGIGTCS